MLCFETHTRYYTVHIQRDLFEGVTVICQWGGKLNARKGRKLYHVATEEALEALLKKLQARRKQHGYYTTTL